jgi:hypothetical protein
VVIHVLLDGSGRYGVVGRTAFFLQRREKQEGRKDEGKDVSSYWIFLRNRKDTGN